MCLLLAWCLYRNGAAQFVALKYANACFSYTLLHSNAYFSHMLLHSMTVACLQGIEARNHAYRAEDGSVLFDTQAFGAGRYGRLGQHGVAGADGDSLGGKRHPADFALWKAAKAGEPSFASDYGPGRPGW